MNIVALRNFFGKNVLFRRSVFLGGFFVVVFGIVFLTSGVFAQSISQEAAFRAAEAATKEFLVKIKNPSNKNNKISTLGKCSDGIVRGKNVYGTYAAEFFNRSDVRLSCGSVFSSIGYLEVTGTSSGRSFTLRTEALEEGGGGALNFRCTGGLPDHAAAYPGDDSPSEDLSWIYASPPGTARKCEFQCESGYLWDNESCSENTGGNEYVTTGPDNQTKEGAFGVKGAFTAFGGVNMNGKRMENVATPIDGSDIATKKYVDEEIQKAFGGK